MKFLSPYSQDKGTSGHYIITTVVKCYHFNGDQGQQFYPTNSSCLLDDKSECLHWKSVFHKWRMNSIWPK